jgi:hypothetical protein
MEERISSKCIGVQLGPVMSIGYKEVRVSAKLLAECEAEKQLATGWGRYTKFKQWLHYANLDRWQKQGHHFHYLSDVSNERKQMICTCGLYITEGGDLENLVIGNPLAMKVSELLLDRLQTVKCHRSFDDFKTLTCALIVDFVWKPEVGDYLWTAFCQECGDVLVEVRNEVAKGFVEAHNRKCLVRHE